MDKTSALNIDGLLKAYWVQILDDDWGMFLHAQSKNKARKIFMETDPDLYRPDWVDIRAVRCKGSDLLDITPFTDSTLRLAGYPIPKPGDPMYDEHDPDGFLFYCPCTICKAERDKLREAV